MPALPKDGARTTARREATTSGFDFTSHMRGLCRTLVADLPEFSHIDVERVAIGFRQTRRRGTAGVQATLTPLRFIGGSRTTKRRGRHWRIDPLVDESGREMLYLLSFYLPRFLETPFEERLITVLHELWHISPAFDGDLRRFAGRCYAHSHSKDGYDREMAQFAKRWLAGNPAPHTHAFLRLELSEIRRLHGPIRGLKFRTPKLRVVANPEA